MNGHANAAGVGRGAEIESSYAWLRLVAALALGTIGSIGMWSFVVALPAVQAGFGVARADASLPFTLTFMGFGLGGVVMGRFADRYGIVVPGVVGGLWCRARRRVAPVHPHLYGLRSRWRGDGPIRRPIRDRLAGGDRRADARRRICALRGSGQYHPVRVGPGADRAGLLGHVRPAD